MEQEKITAQQIVDDLYYLFDKINYGKSALDNHAIYIMNNISSDITQLEKQHINTPSSH